jgi:hypothetical protein
MVVRYMYKGLSFSLANHFLSTGDMRKPRNTWRETRAPRRCSELHRARAVIEVLTLGTG